MNKNDNYCLCSPDFYLTVILVRKSLRKKFRQKILPRDGKRIRPVLNFGNLAVRELPFHLLYHLFGSLMPDFDTQHNNTPNNATQHYAACRNAKCHNDNCHYAYCPNDNCHNAY